MISDRPALKRKDLTVAEDNSAIFKTGEFLDIKKEEFEL
jgi:hypothetical protein